MPNWTQTGIDFGVGAGAGIVDQVVQNFDDKRESNAHAKLPFFKQVGTYVNFGLPLVNLGLVAAGILKGDWPARTTVASAQLAGRKATWQVTKRNRVVTYTVWTKDNALRQAAQKQLLPNIPMTPEAAYEL